MLFDGLRHLFRLAGPSHAAALLLLALAPFQVGAQSLADKVWWSSDHNKLAASVAQATGTPHAGIPYLTTLPTGSANLPAGRIVANASAWPDVAVQTRLPRGGPVIDVKARITPSSAAGAIGRYLTKVGPLANAVALATLAAELGFMLTDNPAGGPPTVSKSDPTICTTAPCYEYNYLELFAWTRSLSTMCNQMVGYLSDGPYTYRVDYVDTPQHRCAMSYRTDGGTVWNPGFVTPTSRGVTPLPPTPVPSSPTELADAIASKSGWPTSSSIGPAIADAIKAGEGVDTTTPTATGPATSPGPTTTTTRPDGKIETKTTTNNYTYNTNTVTITQTTTTSVFNPADNTTETTTEETTPDLPPDECEANPNSLKCSSLDTPTGEIPKSTTTVTYTPASGFGGPGSCPADRSWTSIQTGDTHTASFRPVCDALDLLKPMFIAIALFMGYMIVLPRAD